ncbi:MAG: pyridoxal-phosphate dependent enzyme [Acidobacteria bacterium]|nr:MAG: pyridoxal-phosphate dependent enzyme [Acidobacteriota bacterium]
MNRRSIEQAAERLRPYITRTPLVRSAWLSEASGADVWLKLETAQKTGSFKARGAMHALIALKDRSPEIDRVVTASAGNHGQGLAWAGSHLGIRVRAYAPSFAAAKKRANMRALGAEVVETETYEEAEARAAEDAKASGVPYVSPYNDDDVIAGQGTVALEMCEDAPDIDTFVVAVGGGGLISGCAIVAKDRATPIGVLGAELEASPVFTTSLAAGAITVVTVRPTVADALAGNLEAGSRTFALVQHLVDGMTLVSESSIETAMRGLKRHHDLVTEGAGAAATAAVLQGLGLSGRRVGVIVCGGNVDPDAFAAIVR